MNDSLKLFSISSLCFRMLKNDSSVDIRPFFVIIGVVSPHSHLPLLTI